MSSIAVERNDARTAGKVKTRGRSRTVAKMLLVNRRRTIFLAVFLPLLVGMILALAGVITSLVGHYPLESLGAFYFQNSIHPVVTGIAYISVSFILFSRTAPLNPQHGIHAERSMERFYLPGYPASFYHYSYLRSLQPHRICYFGVFCGLASYIFRISINDAEKT